MISYLLMASKVALSDDPDDKREALIGCIGIRGDGTIVSARNEAVYDTVGKGTAQQWSFPPAHAEARVSKKLDHDAIVYVARVKRSGELAMARPCGDCQRALRSRKVQRVYYTINDISYGIWDPETDTDRVVVRGDQL